MPTITEMKRLLSREHPLYTKLKDLWLWFRTIKTRDIDMDQYLVKGDKESPTDFKIRKKLASFQPESPRIVNRIMGALYKREPEQPKTTGAVDLSRFWEHATLSGDTLPAVIRDWNEFALYYGHAWLHVSRKSFTSQLPEGETEITQADQEALGGEPFVKLYDPLRVINWSVGQDGILDWAVIYSKWNEQAGPLGEVSEIEQYTVLDRSTWQRYRFIKLGERESMEQEQGVYNLGMVPLIPMQAWNGDFDQEPVGESFIYGSAESDRVGFHRDSEFALTLWYNGHPILVTKTNNSTETGGVGEVTLGVQQFLDLRQGDDAFILQVDIGSLDKQRQACLDARRMAWRQAGLSQTGDPWVEGADQVSGISRSIDIGQGEGRTLKALANNRNDAVRNLIECYVRYQSNVVNPPATERLSAGIEIQWSDEFDQFDFGEYTAAAATAKPIIDQSATASRLVAQRVINQLVPDLSAEDVEAIDAELKSNTNKIGSMFEPIKESPIMEPIKLGETDAAATFETAPEVGV